MAKIDSRYRPQRRATCLRCGAPGNAKFKGGQLVPVKGIVHRVLGSRMRPHKKREYQHADSAFCRTRMGDSDRRTPTSPNTNSPRIRR